MQRAQGFAEQGNRTVWTAGHESVTLVQESAPFAIITVYYTGTTALATIYSDNQTPPTPLANPFTANADGHWFFYAPDGRYDVKIQAPEWTWTIGDIDLQDLYSWGRDVQANGHSLLGVGTLQADTGYFNSLQANFGQFGSLQANSIQGNSITSPAFQVQGCITFENPAGWMSICIDQNASLVIHDTTEPVMVIDQQGHVGIGLVAPQSQLEVGGIIRVTGDPDIPTSGAGLEFAYQSTPQLGIVQAYDRTASQWIPIAIDGNPVHLNPNSGGNVIMCLQGGNVGVRESSPQALFEAAGTIRITDDVPVPGAGQGLELGYQKTPPLGIVQAYDRTAGHWIPLVIDGMNAGTVLGVEINGNTAGDVQLCRGGGKVGIGGAFGNYRLDVNGDINISGQYRVNGAAVALGLDRAAQDALEARVTALEAKVK